MFSDFTLKWLHLFRREYYFRRCHNMSYNCVISTLKFCSIFDFKQLTVPKNWIISQSNPFWLYGFQNESIHNSCLFLGFPFDRDPFLLPFQFVVIYGQFGIDESISPIFCALDLVKYWAINGFCGQEDH